LEPFLSSFNFIDEVAEVKKNESLTAFYKLKGDEEFLLDHFKGYPVMPGVLMLESVKQAAAVLLRKSKGSRDFYRLAEIDDVRFGQFIRPGDTLKIVVKLNDAGGGRCEGRIDRYDPETGRPTAKVLSVNLTLVPA
jgi:3-hydroxyacyl-[acyl-carrier-protein] dehydratase